MYIDIGEPLIYFTSEDDDEFTVDNYVEVYPNLQVKDYLASDVPKILKGNRRLME